MEKYEIMAENFIINSMHELMYDQNELPNFTFKFMESDAYKFIYQCMSKNLVGNTNKFSEIEYGLKNIDYSKPVMKVNDYKLFFSLMYDLLDNYKKTYEKNSKICANPSMLYFSMFKFFWLRMTPDDFNHPEKFLKKNILILKDNTFNEYNKKKKLDLKIDKYDVYAKNQLSKSYDEASKEFDFTLEENNKYLHLPLVRYGIYEKDNKKICEIASIQDKNAIDYYYYDPTIYKKINRYKYKLNENVENNLKEGVEPSKLLSLLLFIKLLDNKGINYIKIPSMYVLDYEYHDKRDKNTKNLFNGTWRSKEQIDMQKDVYEEELKYYLKEIDKQDIISEIKTTRFIKLFERLNYHITNSEILEYPMEQSSYMSMKINDLNNIEGKEVSKILKKSR